MPGPQIWVHYTYTIGTLHKWAGEKKYRQPDRSFGGCSGLDLHVSWQGQKRHVATDTICRQAHTSITKATTSKKTRKLLVV